MPTTQGHRVRYVRASSSTPTAICSRRPATPVVSPRPLRWRATAMAEAPHASRNSSRPCFAGCIEQILTDNGGEFQGALPPARRRRRWRHCHIYSTQARSMNVFDGRFSRPGGFTIVQRARAGLSRPLQCSASAPGTQQQDPLPRCLLNAYAICPTCGGLIHCVPMYQRVD